MLLNLALNELMNRVFNYNCLGKLQKIKRRLFLQKLISFISKGKQTSGHQAVMNL